MQEELDSRSKPVTKAKCREDKYFDRLRENIASLGTSSSSYLPQSQYEQLRSHIMQSFGQTAWGLQLFEESLQQLRREQPELTRLLNISVEPVDKYLMEDLATLHRPRFDKYLEEHPELARKPQPVLLEPLEAPLDKEPIVWGELKYRRPKIKGNAKLMCKWTL